MMVFLGQPMPFFWLKRLLAVCMLVHGLSHANKTENSSDPYCINSIICNVRNVKSSGMKYELLHRTK
jgi:hypothetical protein